MFFLPAVVCVQEYGTSGDVGEVARCLRDLDAPAYNHEAVVAASECGTRVQRTPFPHHCYKSTTVRFTAPSLVKSQRGASLTQLLPSIRPRPFATTPQLSWRSTGTTAPHPPTRPPPAPPPTATPPG